MALFDRAQHVTHFTFLYLAATVCDGLVEKTQGITHAAIRGTGDRKDCRGIRLDFFRFHDALQVIGNHAYGQSFQVELQTTGQDRYWQFLWIRGREQEFYMRRRLFQGLQQGIEAVIGQHVYFVDQVDLVATAGWRILHVLEQLTGIFHLGS